MRGSSSGNATATVTIASVNATTTRSRIRRESRRDGHGVRLAMGLRAALTRVFSRRLGGDVQEVHRQRTVVLDLDLLGFLVPAHPRGGNEFAFAFPVLVDVHLDQSELVLKPAGPVYQFPERHRTIRREDDTAAA